MELNIGNTKKGFLSIFREPISGQLSTMRILSCLVILTVLFCWIIFCIMTGSFVTITWQMVVIIIAPLFAKAVQKMSEK